MLPSRCPTRPAVALALLVAAAGPARAMPLEFGFSFDNDRFGSGEVAGTISGLEPGDTDEPATGVTLTSVADAPSAFPESLLGVNLAATARDNSFSVDADGSITDAEFLFFGNSLMPAVPATLSFSIGGGAFFPDATLAGLFFEPDASRQAPVSTPLFTRSGPSEVSSPAPAALLGAGLLALVARRRRARPS